MTWHFSYTIFLTSITFKHCADTVDVPLVQAIISILKWLYINYVRWFHFYHTKNGRMWGTGVKIKYSTFLEQQYEWLIVRNRTRFFLSISGILCVRLVVFATPHSHHIRNVHSHLVNSCCVGVIIQWFRSFRFVSWTVFRFFFNLLSFYSIFSAHVLHTQNERCKHPIKENELNLHFIELI